MKLKKLTLLLLSWRIMLTIVAFASIVYMEFKPSFPYYQETLQPLGPKLLHAWANFDGVHYLTIIQKGYFGTGFIQAFFPLYPFLVRFLTPIFTNPIVAGITLSTVSFFLALIVLSKLMQLDYNKKLVTKTIYLLILFPTAFFFTSLYTESFFLLLILLSFYSARKKSYLLAGIFGALAAATRPVGVLIIPALIIEIWQQSKYKIFINQRNITNIIYSFLPLSGIIAYMNYLKNTFSDPLLFLHVQSSLGAEREAERIILLYQVFWRYIKMTIDVAKDSLIFYNISLEFIVAILFLFLIILSFLKVRRSYATFALLAFIAPTLTGTFSSLPRYVLVLFPAFIMLAKLLKNQNSYEFTLIVFDILLVFNTILFIQGYWVA